MAVEEVDERFDLKIEEPFYETVGGYVFGQLGRAAIIGDEVLACRADDACAWSELDGLRVARLLLFPLAIAER